MLASQLREEIDFRSSNFEIPSSLVCFIAFITMIVLETSLSFNNNLISFYAIDPGSCEGFSMERLELLGDSVLKYAVSCHLFLRDPEKHEGELSMRRSLALSNSTLHKLGTDSKLQVRISLYLFEPFLLITGISWFLMLIVRLISRHVVACIICLLPVVAIIEHWSL